MNPKYRFTLNIRKDTTNLFNPLLITSGYYVQYTTGNLIPNPAYVATDFIQVNPNTGYKGLSINNSLYTFRQMAFYDYDKTYISGLENTAEFTTPNNCYYVRLSYSSTLILSNYGFFRSYITEFDPYVSYTSRDCFPVYKDDLAKDYELETNQRFYRAKLSGKISFIRDDFDYINNSPFDTEFVFMVYKSDDWGKTWSLYYTGKFCKTDCTFNSDDEKITVQPDTLDEYNETLAGLDKEYNLISITPEIERLLIRKRPLIQVYIPGDSIVSCFLGGTFWEQDANATTDRNALINTYHFALCNMLKEINVTGSSNPNVNALYAGRMSVTGTNIFTGSLYPNVSNGFYIRASQQYQPPFWGIITYEIVRTSDNVVLFRYQNASPGNRPFDNEEFDFAPVSGSGSTGNPHAEMATYSIYARYLLDVTTIRGLNTYELPGDDIVDYNRNYRRAIGYAIDIAYISNNYSSNPTEWGRTDDGKYFVPPYSIWGQKYYPIARSTWRYASIWFAFSYSDKWLEEEGRKTYTLRDAFPVGSCIQSLLSQFAPGIKHLETAEYSQFLYGDRNPITGQKFRLFVSQKSNVLVGDYQQPAQKAPTTLQQFTNMLRDCYKCYWYIEDGKFKIEHISWFKNGGSYSGNQIVGMDLTQLENVRNGKKWGFNTSEWSFDKVDMPERFQFEWMDDVTQAFQGYPIEVESKYITPGKIEEINISNFTSDVDMMLLNPGSMSNDGFALFAAVTANALSNDDSGLYPGFGGTSGNNGLTTPTYGIRPELRGISAVLNFTPYSNSGTGTGRIVFYNGGNVISTQGNFTADGQGKQITVTIPGNADAIGLTVTGSVYAYFYKLDVPTRYELPFSQLSVDGVEYYLQNGYLAFVNLQPAYWTYDLPARRVKINGQSAYVQGIERKKKQTLNFPVTDDPNPLQLVKTYIGSGQIDKMSINLCSRSAKTTLKYDTE